MSQMKTASAIHISHSFGNSGLKTLLVVAIGVALLISSTIAIAQERPQIGNKAFMISDEELAKIRQEVAQSPTNFDNAEERYYALESWLCNLWDDGRGRSYKPLVGQNLSVTFDLLQAERDKFFRQIDSLYATFEEIARAEKPGEDVVRLQQDLSLPPRYEADRIHNVVVDASSELGKIKNLNGLNGGPTPVMETDAPLYKQFREAKINCVRLFHDDSRVLLDRVFPVSGRPDADPNDPREYDFGEHDRHLKGAVENGQEVLFTLEYGLGPVQYGRTRNPIPDDFQKWCEVTKHVVMHVNKGWANGHNYNVKYWGIWNEPDTPNAYWRGTPEQYYELFDMAARAIKSADPNAKVIGPGSFRAPERKPDYQPTAFMKGFLEYCAQHRTPLDVVDYHCYVNGHGVNPYRVVEADKQIEEMVAAAGLQPVNTFISEWNMSPNPFKMFDQPVHAVFVASYLAYMQDTKVEQALLFRGNRIHFISSTPTSVDRGLSLYYDDGTPRPGHQAFKVLGEMAEETPVRLACQGSDTKGYAALAGRSNDKSEVRVLASDLNSLSEGVSLQVNRLPWSDTQAFRYEVWQYDSQGNYKNVKSGEGKGQTIMLGDITMSSPAFAVVKIRRAS